MWESSALIVGYAVDFSRMREGVGGNSWVTLMYVYRKRAKRECFRYGELNPGWPV